MHNIFILEDSEDRIKWFKKEFDQRFNLTITTSYTEAVSQYKENYDLILLDHDLGHLENVPSRFANTGYHFCEWLVNQTKQYPVIIHSHNPYGADNMKGLLDRYRFNVSYIPFSYLTRQWNAGILPICGIYKYDI